MSHGLRDRPSAKAVRYFVREVIISHAVFGLVCVSPFFPQNQYWQNIKTIPRF